MANSGKYILSKFHGDKLDLDEVSGLSLFLFTRNLIVLAKNESKRIAAVNLYSFQERSDLNNIIDEDPLINSPNTSGRLYLHNGCFILVPQSLFDPSHCDAYLNLHTSFIPSEMEVFYDGVHGNSIQVVGCAEKELLSALDTALPDLDVSSGATVYLSFLLDSFTPSNEQELVLMPSLGSLYVGAFQSGKLVLFNHFPIHTEQDLMKYLFSTVKTLGFDQQTIQAWIIGDLAHVFGSTEQLQPFFNRLDHMATPETLLYEPGAIEFQKSGLLEAYWGH
ncbi:hypothetical protein ADIS_3418 [Lunatimonas lonarensis]|uniref:DUF3822 domain-containing protein n=1 Tax=Lunatimonas lonarensis TaxID=1232681 RepID=R7ZQA0_9BACT|nr:DUF3822 family protein [Lunatimonas lonarensis]EON76290.1 hypothetical protein ADIS_3418 [Lunatimonas lonarensis]